MLYARKFKRTASKSGLLYISVFVQCALWVCCMFIPQIHLHLLEFQTQRQAFISLFNVKPKEYYCTHDRNVCEALLLVDQCPTVWRGCDVIIRFVEMMPGPIAALQQFNCGLSIHCQTHQDILLLCVCTYVQMF